MEKKFIIPLFLFLTLTIWWLWGTYNDAELEFNDFINAVVLLLTATIIFWYTKETSDLRKITQRQLKEAEKVTFLNQAPLIRLQWGEQIEMVRGQGFFVVKQGYYRIRVINEGRGMATHIRLNTSHNYNFSISILAPEIATKSFTDITEEYVKVDGKPMERTQFHKTFNPEASYEVEVWFNDVAGNGYKQIFVTDPTLNDGFKLRQWSVPKDLQRTEMRQVSVLG